MQDALEAQQAAAASAGTASMNAAGLESGEAASGKADGGSGSDAKAAEAAALHAAHQSVLTQFAFGFRAIQAPKVGVASLAEPVLGLTSRMPASCVDVRDLLGKRRSTCRCMQMSLMETIAQQ